MIFAKKLEINGQILGNAQFCLLTAADRNKIVRCRPKPSFYAGHFASLIMHEVIYFLKAPSYRFVQNFLVVLAVFL